MPRIRDRVLFFLSYATAFCGGMALTIYLVSAVWCLGDQKWNGGCGGWQVYYVIWVITMAPGALGVFWVAVGLLESMSARVTTLASGLIALFGWTMLCWNVSWLDSPAGILGGILFPGLVAWILSMRLE